MSWEKIESDIEVSGGSLSVPKTNRIACDRVGLDSLVLLDIICELRQEMKEFEKAYKASEKTADRHLEEIEEFEKEIAHLKGKVATLTGLVNFLEKSNGLTRKKSRTP